MMSIEWASHAFRQLPLQRRRHKAKAILQCTFYMAQFAADSTAKGLLILMTCSSVVTGLAHAILIILFNQIVIRRAIFRRNV